MEREGLRPHRKGRAAPRAARPHNSLGALLAAGHSPGPHLPGVGGRGGGAPGGCSEKFRTAAHSQHRTYPAAERDVSSLRLQGPGGAGPRHSAAATAARGRECAGPQRAARRPPPNFAQRQHGTASPSRLAHAAAALPRPGEGLAPSTRRPGLLPPPPAPTRSQAGRPGGTQHPAPSSDELAAAARTVTLAAFSAIYIFTIGFHS